MSEKIAPALTQTQTVEWRHVIGYEGFYEVSNLGDVRRVKRPDSLGRPRRCGTLRQVLDRGYVRFSLSKNDQRVSISAHRMVAAAFIGPPPTPAHVVNHRDGIKSNNRPSNLEYLTSGDNTRHAAGIGLHPSGERHGMTAAPSRHATGLHSQGVEGWHVHRAARSRDWNVRATDLANGSSGGAPCRIRFLLR